MTDQTPQEGELILYRTADDAVRVEVLYESETFWLDQRRMAELFGVDVRTVSYHLKEVYASGELSPEATLRRIWRVQREGNREVRREIEFYNLDAIISVGYRVNSTQATVAFEPVRLQAVLGPDARNRHMRNVVTQFGGQLARGPMRRTIAEGVTAPKREDDTALRSEHVGRAAGAAPDLTFGSLIETGWGPYQFRDKARESPYLRIATDQGERVLWGVDFPRALAQAETQPQPGDRIGIQYLGKRAVTAKVPVKDQDGSGTTRHRGPARPGPIRLDGARGAGARP